MEDGIGRYIEFIKQILSKSEDLSGMKVVLDCSNGAGYKVGPEVLFELGAEVMLLVMNLMVKILIMIVVQCFLIKWLKRLN